MPKESAERVGSGCFWGKENGEEFVLSDSVHIYDSDRSGLLRPRYTFWWVIAFLVLSEMNDKAAHLRQQPDDLEGLYAILTRAGEWVGAGRCLKQSCKWKKLGGNRTGFLL